MAKRPAPGSTLFLSDLHLDCLSPRKARALAAVVRHGFAEASDVFLLGDMGDGLDHPDCRRFVERLAGGVLDALARHARRGVTPWYIPGNHDDVFRHGPMDWARFAVRSTGNKVPVVMTKHGRTLRLSHGDEWDQDEENPLVIWINKTINDEPLLRMGRNILNPVLIPVRFGLYELGYAVWGNGRWVADRLEGLLPDVAHDLRRAAEWAKKSPGAFVHSLHLWEDATRRVMKMERPDLLAMGHTHVPILEELEGGIHLNTGDWLEHAVVSWMDDKGVYQQDLTEEQDARFVPSQKRARRAA